MSTWTNAVLTNQGATLLAKLTSGTSLTITRAATGTGYVNTDTLPQQTSLSGERQAMQIKAVSYPSPGTCVLPVTLTNDSVSTSYTVTQIGIFAQDPDVGEILLFIAQALAGTGTDVPAVSVSPGFSAEWEFYLQYGQADGVTVTVSQALSVTYQDLNQAVSSLTAQINQKADQTDLESLQTSDAGKLPLAGGIMTGDIQMRTARYISTPLKVTDSGTTYGQLLQIGAGGDVVIGSGESQNNLPSAEGIDGSTETMNIASDTEIAFYTNCNTIANRKKVTIDTNGRITVPVAPTDNMQLANKQYVDNLANQKQKAITFGTAAPTGGSNGDIYIQY